MARNINDIRADLAAAQEKYTRITDEFTELHRSIGNRSSTDGEYERISRLEKGAEKAAGEIARFKDEWRDAVQELASNPGNVEHGDGAASVARTVSHRGSERDSALRVIERSAKSGDLLDHAAENATALIERSGSPADQSLAARWVATTGDDAYRSAFVKMLSDPVRGHMLWTPQEQAAYQAATAVKAELSRTAMSLTDANGGLMVPLSLDPALNLSSDGSINPLRRISRVVQTATESWTGLTTAGATSEWKSEASEAADGSPTVDDTAIPVHFGDTFVPYSFEVGMDAVNFLAELRKVMLDSADQLMATAYTTGSGTGQPKGIVTALTGTASEINSSGEAIVAADAFSLQNALPPRFQARAQWCMNLAIINTFRQLETTNGALKFPELTGGHLLNRAVNELSNMDGAINAAATANNYVALYGDFSNFVIVDRIGTTLELIPNLVGANRRPTGQRGAFLWFRTGSDCLVPQAFRMLDVPTTA